MGDAPARGGEAVQQYEDFIRSVVDWVWEVDSNLNYLFVSKGIARAFGVPAEALLGSYLFSLTYFKQVDEALLATVEAMEDRVAFRDRAVSLEDAHGTNRILLLSGVPVFESDSGRYRGYRGTGTEITERRRSEVELEDLSAAVEDLTELSSAWCWQADAELRITQLSEDYAEHAGLPRDRSLGRRFDELWRLGEAARTLIDSREDFRGQRSAWTHASRDEERRFVIGGRPVFDERGNFNGYRGIGLDVSGLLGADQGALTAREAAERESRAKSEFLANMSHELRTPLNAIIGFSDAMRSQTLGKISKRYQQYAEDIHLSAHHVLDIINQILDLSRIEAGKVELEEETLDVAELLESCRRMIHAEIEKAELELAIEVETELPRILADPAKLKQVVLNLLANAAKFTPPGGRIDLVARPASAGGLEIEIVDTGMGMSAKEIPEALTRFGRTEDAERHGLGGAGLGLSITKSLVELHGGTLAIVSRKGKGTRATVRLPKDRVLGEDDSSEPWKILF
jgi:PAS domain S-box-containing protein